MKITERQKQRIRDMRMAGFSYGEIAEMTDLSANTVKSLCYRENIECLNGEAGTYDCCKACGKPLRHNPGRKRKLFCDDKCRSDWWNRNRGWARRKDAYRLICHYCGAEFDSYGNRNRKYCGRDCYTASRYGEGLP